MTARPRVPGQKGRAVRSVRCAGPAWRHRRPIWTPLGRRAEAAGCPAAGARGGPGGERAAEGSAEVAEARARRHGPGARAGRAGGSAPAAPDRPRRQAHAAGHGGARPHGGAAGLAAQGLPALHGPGPRPRAAGDPLPAGAVGDPGRPRAGRPAAAGGGGPLRLRRGVLRPDAARPGAGHRRSPAGPAAGLGHPHCQGPARRPADRAQGRLPRRRGRDPGGRAGDCALGDGRRHGRAARRAGWDRDAHRRRPLRRLATRPSGAGSASSSCCAPAARTT